MIGFFVFIFLAGVGMIVAGILIQKNYYGDAHYVEATVVGFQNAKGSSLAMTAAMRLLQNGFPIVEFSNDQGEAQQARLNLQIAKQVFSKYPELDIGGTVDILYFGKHPKQVYLVNHPLEQTVMRFSMFVPGGIAVMILAVGLFIFYLSI